MGYLPEVEEAAPSGSVRMEFFSGELEEEEVKRSALIDVGLS